MTPKLFLKFLSFLWLGGMTSALFAFITQIILARYMTISEFGMFNSGLTFMVITSTLYGFGTDTAILQLYGKSEKNGLSYTKSLIYYLVFSCILYTTCLLIYFKYFSHNTYSTNIYKLIPTFIAISILNVKFSLLQIKGKFDQLSLCQILLNGLRLFMILIFLVFNKNISNSVYNIFLVTSIILIIFCIPDLISLNKKSKETYQHNLPSFLKKILPFGVITSTFAIYSQSIIIITHDVLNENITGYLSIALNIMLAIYILPVIIYQKILLPIFHRQSYHNKNNLLRNYQKGCGYMLIFGMLIFIFMFFLSKDIILILFGKDYEKSAYIVKYISICIPLRFISSNVGAVLSTGNLIYKKMNSTIILAILSVITSYYLINAFNLIGIIYAIILNELFMFILYFYMIWKYSFGNNTFKNWFKLT